jgi:hypothetical protein
MNGTKMKPSLFNYCLAHGFLITTCGAVLIAAILLTRQYFIAGVFSLEAKYIILSCLIYIPACLLGFILGVFPTWAIVGNIVGSIQGAPFYIGDTVCILTGKHKGKITTVYEVWEFRGQVKVDLGPEEKNKVTDVFCNVAVFKIEEAEQTARDNARK